MQGIRVIPLFLKYINGCYSMFLNLQLEEWKDGVAPVLIVSIVELEV